MSRFGEQVGVLRRRHPSEFDEFWWTLDEATWFAVEPGASFYVPNRRFHGAEWHRDRLTIDRGSFLTRILPLIRSDALALVSDIRDYDRS